MKTIALLFILALSIIPIFSQDKSEKPFVLKLIEKPKELRIGQTNKFVFEVRNISKEPLTLSSFCASAANLSWNNGDGTGGGTGGGCGGSGLTKSDFFTLEPNNSKRFETELVIPDDIKARRVNVNIKFEPKYDGKIVGINAWTGEASYIVLRMQLKK